MLLGSNAGDGHDEFTEYTRLKLCINVGRVKYGHGEGTLVTTVVRVRGTVHQRKSCPPNFLLWTGETHKEDEDVVIQAKARRLARLRLDAAPVQQP